MEAENEEFSRLGAEKYQARFEVMSALDSVKKGVLNILTPWEGVSEVTLKD